MLRTPATAGREQRQANQTMAAALLPTVWTLNSIPDAGAVSGQRGGRRVNRTLFKHVRLLVVFYRYITSVTVATAALWRVCVAHGEATARAAWPCKASRRGHGIVRSRTADSQDDAWPGNPGP